MRAIKYKYALNLEMSISDEDMVHDAVEQAIEISKELGIRIHLVNPFTKKDCYINMYESINEKVKELT
jgi:hypothetical protein